MTQRLEITRDIAASPQAVYDAISDITRMGEWSTECVGGAWTGESTEPVVGATFEGYNRNGDKEWTTQATITEAVPGERFVFECSLFDFHFSTWGYEIAETAEGCRVTEWSEDLRPESALEFSATMSGVADRTAQNHSSMSATLDALAAALESA